MEKSEKNISFFLGANSAGGFVSLFGQIYDPRDGWRGYIIKGGPGTGKSGMMRKIGEAAEAAGCLPIWIYCSSDSDSLDAVILPELKFFILDGTPPHSMEPKYPGAVENIINLGECWDSELLAQNKEKIMAYSAACSDYHAQSNRFLAAAGMLKKDSYRLTLPLIKKEKIESYAKRLALNNFRAKKNPRLGREYSAMLSGITPNGIVCFEKTVTSLCDAVYVIEDNFGAVSDMLLREIKENTLRLGVDVISCGCPLFPQESLEHLIMPECGVAFLTSNYANRIGITPTKQINIMRFLDAEALKEHRQRLRFNKRASTELLGEAILLQKLAKSAHDKLENCYIQAMDFHEVNRRTRQIISEII